MGEYRELEVTTTTVSGLSVHEALRYKACMTRSTIWYTSCIDLIEGLKRHVNRDVLKRRLTWLRKPHLILIDEVGHENLSKEEANILSQVLNTRYEDGSMILTTNKAFKRWAEAGAGRECYCYCHNRSAPASCACFHPKRRFIPDERPA